MCARSALRTHLSRSGQGALASATLCRGLACAIQPSSTSTTSRPLCLAETDKTITIMSDGAEPVTAHNEASPPEDTQPTSMAADTASADAAPPDSALPSSATPQDAAPELASKSASRSPKPSSSSGTQAANPALAARMARFKALQSQKRTSSQANIVEVQNERRRAAQDPAALEKIQKQQDLARYKLLKDGDPDFERKRAWDYTAEEDEKWAKRVEKKQRHAHDNAFQDFRREANKVYKRQIKQLSKVDMDSYAVARAEKLQRQVTSGLLKLVETDDGDVFTVDPQIGRAHV